MSYTKRLLKCQSELSIRDCLNTFDYFDPETLELIARMERREPIGESTIIEALQEHAYDLLLEHQGEPGFPYELLYHTNKSHSTEAQHPVANTANKS